MRQPQACLLGSKLETALICVFTDRPRLCKTESISREAHLVTQHVLVICKVLRAFTREDRFPTTGSGRRYPRTSAIRRRLRPADWTVLRLVVNKVKLPGLRDRDESSSMESVVLPTVTGRDRFDDDGFPDFARMVCDSNAAIVAAAVEVPTESDAVEVPKEMEAVEVPTESAAIVVAAVEVPTKSDATLDEAAKVPTEIPMTADGFPDWARLVHRGASEAFVAKSDDTSGPSPKRARVDEVSAPRVVPVCTPNYRMRKQMVLSARKAKDSRKRPPTTCEARAATLDEGARAEKDNRPKPQTACEAPSSKQMLRTPPRVSEAPAAKLDDIPFDAVKVAIATKGDVRYQITATVRTHDGQKKRLHVCTLHEKSWGASWRDDGVKLADFCRRSGMTKSGVLVYKASL